MIPSDSILFNTHSSFFLFSPNHRNLNFWSNLTANTLSVTSHSPCNYFCDKDKDYHPTYRTESWEPKDHLMLRLLTSNVSSVCTHKYTRLHLSQNQLDSILTEHEKMLGKIFLISFRSSGKDLLLKKKKKNVTKHLIVQMLQ